jgi:hypothetical protein
MCYGNILLVPLRLNSFIWPPRRPVLVGGGAFFAYSTLLVIVVLALNQPDTPFEDPNRRCFKCSPHANNS